MRKRLFLDGMRMFHAMESSKRYSAGVACDDLTLSTEVHEFETHWLSSFWPSVAVESNEAFEFDCFKKMKTARGIPFHPTPPRRHSKNVLESKHGIIFSILLLLSDTESVSTPAITAQRATRISNDRYVSDILSAYESIKGYMRPLFNVPVLRSRAL